MPWGASGATTTAIDADARVRITTLEENAGYIAKSANYTLSSSDYQLECTANSFTVTLPTAVSAAGKKYSIKNSGTGLITLDGATTETIDGNLTASLIQYDNLTIMSNGANWIIL